MIAISDVMKNRTLSEQASVLEAQKREKEYDLRSFKCNVPMTYEEFNWLIAANCNDIMLERSLIHEYQIDKQNEPIIRQLYLYFMNDPTCEWNLNAGLMFGGKVGCGKTLMLTAFFRITDHFTRKSTCIFHSKDLAGEIKKSGVDYFLRRPVMIDDIGREESETRDWGKVVKPVIDIFDKRYKSGARTYGTTNFNYKTLEGFYGEYIRSRMEEMMTFVVIPGESRRLKNEVKK